MFEFIIIFGLITWHKFMKTNINTHNDVYCMILKLTFRYEYFTTLILHETWLEFVKNCRLSKLFEFSIIFGHITMHKLMKINMNTPHYVYYKNFQLAFRCEHFLMLFLHETLFRCITNYCFNVLFWDFHHFWPHKCT